MNYDQVMSSGVTAGTTLHSKRKKLWHWIGWGTGMLVISANLIWSSENSLRSYSQEKRIERARAPAASQGTSIPLASQPTATWPKVTLPPRGKSEHISQPPGKRVMVDGKQFRYHCVYADGSEQSFVPGGAPCPGGNMPFVYVSNESNESNVVSYAYETIR